ncbi:hypothetical protein TWF569_003108 [Orbilia oligospora]|uniref:S-adenosyl-L-methionine-dependent methyltransferase n=1 Tax=Orbilia oligospora TaxID=2813651 RepID=A0A7C8N3P7_ORBOL|nr:hypothetical protein TWF706_002817 [Orbilia oligospora]KAF3081253.1 hypothetical protein TWF102_001721 [Orbilia oligospora]KAF3082208.1 hypothetical protein TWF103_003387 [Orbilia oligospora]KAF3120540.1 hypothetical protein TWF569_003108 [Orbilia oligospora]KAF3143594.1 hypothetical protein TWF594_005141 [Orbilia oligospora]
MSEQEAPTLQAQFAATNGDHQSLWKALWDNGTYLPWDRGQSSPSLVDLLNDHPSLITPSSPSQQLTALVPGCGRGYDVLLFASHGLKSYGLELSSSAVTAARENAKTSGLNPELHTFITGDFFTKNWQSGENSGTPEEFDVVYDYTFLCAMDPSQGLREKWADRMAGLVKKGGVLICLEFPLYKDLELPGPPWPLREEIYKGLLENVGFVREMYVTPRRYLESGEGSDMVSVWRRQ